MKRTVQMIYDNNNITPKGMEVGASTGLALLQVLLYNSVYVRNY